MSIFEPISLLINDCFIKIPQVIGKDTNSYYYKNVYSIEQSIMVIREKLRSDKPCMIGRLGTTECQTVYKYLHKKYGLPTGSPIMGVLCNNSGFFPNDERLWKRFAEIMISSMKYADIQAVLYSGGGENYLIKNYASEATLIPNRSLDPIYGWSDVLEGKKVLVVHPFEKTINYQYENNRTQIYPATNILPEFQLSTIRAVQTLAGSVDTRFETWFDALDYMTEEISKKDFDIAILGCGAYGYPLAARIKQMGKKSIHMGAASQLLFGIMGQRWEDDSRITSWVNGAWRRPMDSERIENFRQVENGCYW